MRIRNESVIFAIAVARFKLSYSEYTFDHKVRFTIIPNGAYLLHCHAFSEV